jgi:thiamine pyrophosphate-dependent acetolactate synthase large subunit-like protein
MHDLSDLDLPQPGGPPVLGWGSDLVAEMLRRTGIEYVALNPGASLRGLHDSLVNYLGNRAPQLLLCLHEDSATAIAHGYAKACDRPMAVALHANVGLMHGLLGIWNAWCDRVPMLVLGANGPVDAMRRRPWMDWMHTTKDQGALARHSVKWDDEPRSPGALVESLARADAVMRERPCGPVHVCLDAGLQEQALDQPVALPDLSRHRAAEPAAADPETVERAAAMLAGARRPVLMVGRTTRSRSAWDARVRLAETLGARVITDLKSPAAFPTTHPLHVTGLTLRISAAALAAVRDADVVLRLDWVDPGGFFAALGGPPQARVIDCTLDPHLHHGASAEHHGLSPIDLPVRAEPDRFVAQLMGALGLKAHRPQAHPATRVEVGVASAAVPSTAAPDSDAAIDPTDVARALAGLRRSRPLTLARVPIAWDGDAYPFEDPLDYLGYDGGGGLSSGPGNTVGAALALSGTGRTVVGVLGDGDFMQGASALWTAARYRIPALFVISNNRSNFTDVGHQALMARQRDRPESNRWIGQNIDDPAIDFAGLARAQGVEAIGPVGRREDLDAALRDAAAITDSGRPALVDLVVARR